MARPTITRRALGDLISKAIGKDAAKVYRGSTAIRNRRARMNVFHADPAYPHTGKKRHG